MKINKKIEIGINVVSRLKSSSTPMKATVLAESAGTSIGFLEQIMKKLKKAQIVISKQGPGGGYTFNKLIDPVTAFDVARAMGEQFAPFQSDVNLSIEERINSEIRNAFINTKI